MGSRVLTGKADGIPHHSLHVKAAKPPAEGIITPDKHKEAWPPKRNVSGMSPAKQNTNKTNNLPQSVAGAWVDGIGWKQ